MKIANIHVADWICILMVTSVFIASVFPPIGTVCFFISFTIMIMRVMWVIREDLIKMFKGDDNA